MSLELKTAFSLQQRKTFTFHDVIFNVNSLNNVKFSLGLVE